MTRVVVTGASGFVGRHVVPLLVQRGDHVVAVSRAPGPPTDGVTWWPADLLDPRAREALVAGSGAECLLHLAWDATPGAFWTSAANVGWAAASLELVAGFSRHGGRRVVGVGSCAEYAPTDRPCSEGATPERPASLYGAAKLACGSVLSRAGPVLGVEVAWARLFFLYGPGEPASKLVASLARSLVRGEPATCRHPALVRDFLHVADVAAALVALLHSGLTGPVNVASGVPVRIGALAATLGRVASQAALVREGAEAVPAGEPPTVVAAVDRLRDELGWERAWDLDRGLADTLAWWARSEGRVASR